MHRALSWTLAAVALSLAGQVESQENSFGAGEVPKATDDGGYRYFEVATSSGPLNMRTQPAATSGIVAAVPRGTILNNLGCTGGDSRAWCDVQPVGGGPRGFVAADFLKAAASPGGGYATGIDESALRAGRRDFDATGNVPCKQTLGQPTTSCAMGVARAGGGDATVVVTRPDGRDRVIFFSLGRAIGAGTSEADPGAFSMSREADLTIVQVGAERYEIPDAVVFGG